LSKQNTQLYDINEKTSSGNSETIYISTESYVTYMLNLKD